MSPRTKGDRHAVVPDAEPRSYYDQPVLKQPVWTFEIPLYFAAGGMAGTSSVMAVFARAAGDERLARVATRAAAAGALISPVLLISDLGKPSRFYNMLRIFKPTSPMSVGSWVLAAYAPAAVGTALAAELDVVPVLRRIAGVAAAALGPVLVTYTAVLVADTAVPVWHDARRELPFAFVGGAVQSAAAVALAATPPAEAGAARNLFVAGNVVRETASRVMEHRLGDLAAPYHEGRAGRFQRASRWLSAAGVTTALTVARRQRGGAMVAGALGGAGAVCERFAVLAAGAQSAADPQATIGPQRRRVDGRDPREASTTKSSE